MKVHTTNKKCDSSVLLPPQMQTNVPKNFPRISMWTVFISWSLFRSLKLKSRQLAHRGFYSFILLDVLPIKKMTTQIKQSINGPWRFLACNLTEVILSFWMPLDSLLCMENNGHAAYLQAGCVLWPCPPPEQTTQPARLERVVHCWATTCSTLLLFSCCCLWSWGTCGSVKPSVAMHWLFKAAFYLSYPSISKTNS